MPVHPARFFGQKTTLPLFLRMISLFGQTLGWRLLKAEQLGGKHRPAVWFERITVIAASGRIRSLTSKLLNSRTAGETLFAVASFMAVA